jgi:hypothetical protein
VASVAIFNAIYRTFGDAKLENNSESSSMLSSVPLSMKAWLGAFRFLLPAMLLHPFNVAEFPALVPFIASRCEIIYGAKSLLFKYLKRKRKLINTGHEHVFKLDLAYRTQ